MRGPGTAGFHLPRADGSLSSSRQSKNCCGGSRFYVFLNDTERPPNPDLLSAFQEYEVRTISWSQRSQHVEELAA
jgi:hypothetical protein